MGYTVNDSMRYGRGRHVVSYDYVNDITVITYDASLPGHLSNAQWVDDNGTPVSEGDPREETTRPKLSVTCSNRIGNGDSFIFTIFRSDSRPDTPRERITGTNIRDPASNSSVGIASAKWMYQYKDEDYDKSPKFRFEASSRRGGRVECPNEFDTKWKMLSESDIKKAEKILRRGLKHNSLKKLINRKTTKLAEIIIANITALDRDTQVYIQSQRNPQRSVKKILDKITVYDGVTEQGADPAFGLFDGVPNLFSNPKLAALTLGNNIYFRENELPQVLGQDDAALLVHEVIHSIQVQAFGLSTGRDIKKRDKRAHFVTFCLNNAYTEENVYEAVAYEFGGGIDRRTFPNLDSNNQIMKTQYPNWWL